MSLRYVVITMCAIVHLCLVVAFVSTNFPHNVNVTWLRRSLETYQNFSGLFRDYSFFAPRVGTDLRAAFLLEFQSGETKVFSFTSNNREANFRYNNIVVSSMRDERGRDLFARSWAAKVLGEQTDAKKVTIVVESMDLPKMQEFKQGVQPEWRLVYVGTFDRKNVTKPAMLR